MIIKIAVRYTILKVIDITRGDNYAYNAIVSHHHIGNFFIDIAFCAQMDATRK